MKKQDRAFTLIELIVVVAIIAMLISVILSSLGQARQKSRDAAKIQAMREVRTALQLYFTENGFYPGGDQTTLANYLVNVTKKYITSIDTNIKYNGTDGVNASCLSNCPSYHLGIILERSDNPILKSDKDANIPAGTFSGTSTDCAATVGTELCYDLVP